MLWGAQSEAEKKAAEEARKAEEERLAAVHKLEEEYQANFDSDIERLQKERDDRVAYARKIGADVLQIEAYYAGEIEKVRRTTVDISIESGRIEEAKREIQERYAGFAATVRDENLKLAKATTVPGAFAEVGSFYLRQIGITREWTGTIEDAIAYAARLVDDNGKQVLRNLLALQSSTVETLSSSAIAALNEQMREELAQVVYQLQLFEERAQGAMQGISTTLADSLKQGVSAIDFKTTIMDMLRNMAIDAAIIASGFQTQFAAIGTMIAEAMKDGFDTGELDTIGASIDALYAQALAAVAPINALFEGRLAAPEIPSNALPFNLTGVPTGASAGSPAAVSAGATTINISTTSDPLTIANALSNVQQSLAYAGVV
jgi:hypothetical protein